MTFSPETNEFKVYVQLRPRTHEFKRCLRTTAEVLRQFPQACVDIGGLSRDTHQIHITLKLTIADPGNPTQVTRETLQFSHSIFSKLFDYLPCYAVEPTQQEQHLATKFLSLHAPDVYAPTLEETLLSAEMKLVNL